MSNILLKFLLCSFTIQLTSSPNFWNELLLLIASFTFTWQCFVYINQLYKRIQSEYEERFKYKVHPLVSRKGSRDSVCFSLRLSPSSDPRGSSSAEIMGSRSNVMKKKSSSNLSLVLSQRDFEEERTLAYRVDYFLTVSPSDYIRLDREKRKRDVRLESCYELTYLLEKVLTKYEGDKNLLSWKAIENNLSSIREKFKTEMAKKTSHTEFHASSIQSLLIPLFNNDSTAFFLPLHEDIEMDRSKTGDKTKNENEEKICKEEKSSALFTNTSVETIIDISNVARNASKKSVPCRYDIF